MTLRYMFVVYFEHFYTEDFFFQHDIVCSGGGLIIFALPEAVLYMCAHTHTTNLIHATERKVEKPCPISSTVIF